MEELRYQVDLLNAMNQKLKNDERMLRLVCETLSSAFIYVNFRDNYIWVLANWDFLFPDVEIKEIKDMSKLYEKVEAEYVLPLRDLLFLEKSELSSNSGIMKLKGEKTWIECEVSVVYDKDKNPTDKVIRFNDISKFKS